MYLRTMIGANNSVRDAIKAKVFNLLSVTTSASSSGERTSSSLPEPNELQARSLMLRLKIRV